MLYTRFIVALSLLVAVCNGQTTVNLKNVTVTWQNVGTRTVFNVSSPLSGISSVNNAWLGIGLGTTTGMVENSLYTKKINHFIQKLRIRIILKTGMNAVICRYGPSGTSVKNNLNTAVFSAPMDSTRPQLGLSDTSVFISQNNFVCNFARDNANSLQGYLTVSPSVNLYILMAYGTGRNF
jgi:archaellin